MYELFMVLLFAVSVLNGLFTEAVKKILKEKKVNYSANTITGCIAIVLSIAVGVCYVIMTGAVVNAQLIIWLVALVLLSWLAAMVGYDKVIQAITQIKTGKYTEMVKVYDEESGLVGEMPKEQAEKLAAAVTTVK